MYSMLQRFAYTANPGITWEQPWVSASSASGHKGDLTPRVWRVIGEPQRRGIKHTCSNTPLFVILHSIEAVIARPASSTLDQSKTVLFISTSLRFNKSLGPVKYRALSSISCHSLPIVTVLNQTVSQQPIRALLTNSGPIGEARSFH